MTRRVLLGAALSACCAAAPAPAVALVSRSDAAATHAYLEAVLAERREMKATGNAQLEAITALAGRISAECPAVLAGAPPHVKGEQVNASTREIEDEVVTASFNAAEHVVHPVFARFAHNVARLRWSNGKLTRLLRSLAKEASVQSAIPAPDLCADLRYWVASGYTKVSPGTATYATRLEAASSITLIESEPHEPVEDIFNITALVRHRLKPYEDRRDQLLARKAFPHQLPLSAPQFKPLLEALAAVGAALGKSSP